MTVKFTNNASSTVGTGINTSATSLTVASASAFPQLAGADDYCYLTIQGATSTTREVVKATALSSNTFTIVRAQDNTSAGTWSVGDIVELRLTSALLQDVIDQATVEGIKTNFQYIPTSNQTAFDGADNSGDTMIINDAELVNVYMNGVRLVQGSDYTVSSSNNRITLSTGATTADVIDIEVFGNFTGQSGAAVAITGGAIAGTAITGGSINNTPVGATQANTVAATTLTANSLAVDNITIDGNEIDVSSGDLTLDVAGDITLDADGGDIFFADAGLIFGKFSNASSSLQIKSEAADADIIFKGNDGGTPFTALTLDMSAAGAATFNSTISSGGITSSSGITANGPFKSGGSNNYILFDYDGDFSGGNYYAIQDTSANRLRISYGFSATDNLELDSSGNFYVNGGNSTFAGTISGGAITSSGNIVNTGTIQATHSATISAQTNMQLALRDADSVNMRANFMVEDNTNTNRGGLAIQATKAGVSNDRDIYLQPHGGRVGVLTSSPQYGLDVNTTSRFVHDATFAGAISSGAITSSSTVTGQKLVSTEGVLELDDNGTHNGIINVPASLRINIDSDNNSTGESFQIGNNVTNISGSGILFKIDEAGNATLGNASYGSSLGQLRVVNDASSVGPASLSLFGFGNRADDEEFAKLEFAMQTSGTGGQVVAKINGVAEGTAENAADLLFHTATSGTLSERMRLTSGGNVAIGSQNAYKPLTISGAFGTQKADLLDLQSTAGGGGTQPMIRFGTMAANSNTMARIGVVDIPNYGGGFVVETNSSGGATDTTTEKFRIDKDGHVGIGAASPQHELIVHSDTNPTLGIVGAGYNDLIAIRFGGGDLANALGNTNSGAAILSQQAVAGGQAKGDLQFQVNTGDQLETALTLSDSGIVTAPKLPAFRAARDTSDYSHTTGNPVQFNTTGSTLHFDTGNDYSTTTYRFTAPVAGVYTFHCVVIWTGLSDGNSMIDSFRFKVNGGIFGGYSERRAVYKTDITGTAGYFVESATDTYKLSAQDYVEVIGQKSLTIHANAQYTRFTGYLIG